MSAYTFTGHTPNQVKCHVRYGFKVECGYWIDVKFDDVVPVQGYEEDQLNFYQDKVEPKNMYQYLRNLECPDEGNLYMIEAGMPI